MRRIALLALIVAAALVATVEPSLAKLPPWTCELPTTRPDRSWRIPSIPRFLKAQAEGSGAAGYPTLAEAIRFVRPGVYRARIVFPDTSTYRIEACDTTYDQRGYPAGDGLVVNPRAFVGADPGRAGSPPEPSGIGGALIVAGLGAAALVARARRRRLSTS